MLTVPLQGVSAAVMAVRLAGEMSLPANHSGLEQMADCHGMSMSQAADSAKTGHAAVDHHTSAKLKVCGSCCIGAMLSACSALSFASLDGSDSYLSLLSRDPAGFIPDGLERPPRAFS
jgi:hypothetical protein